MHGIGFIIATYTATFVSSALLAGYFIRRGKQLAAQLPPEDKPWI